MIESEKESNTLIKILLFLFLAFIIMLLAKENGYYEYQTYNKTRLTKEAMIKFENDVENGENVSINDYLEDEVKDYSNIVTKTGSKINEIIESFMNNGIKKTLKFISALFYK